MKTRFKQALINAISSTYMLPLYISLLFLWIIVAFPTDMYRVVATLILVAVAIYYVLRIYVYLKLGVFQKTRYLPRLSIGLTGFNKGLSVFLLITSVIGLVEPCIARVVNLAVALFASTVLTIVMIYVLRKYRHKIKSYMLNTVALIMIMMQYLLGIVNDSNVKNTEGLLKLLEEILHGS